MSVRATHTHTQNMMHGDSLLDFVDKNIVRSLEHIDSTPSERLHNEAYARDWLVKTFAFNRILYRIKCRCVDHFVARQWFVLQNQKAELVFNQYSKEAYDVDTLTATTEDAWLGH